MCSTKKKRNLSTVTKLQSSMLHPLLKIHAVGALIASVKPFFVTSVNEKWLQFSFLEPTKYFSYNYTAVGVHDTQHHF